MSAFRQKLYIIIYYRGVFLVLSVNWSNGIQLGIFVFVGDVLVFHFGKKIVVERIGYGNFLVEHIFYRAIEHPVSVCPYYALSGALFVGNDNMPLKSSVVPLEFYPFYQRGFIERAVSP